MTTELDPKKAILVYDCKAGDESFEYMEMIEYVNGQPTRAYPVPESFFEEISQQFKKEQEKTFSYSKFKDMSSENVKMLGFYGSDDDPILYFYTPPYGYKLYFTKKELKSTLYPMPGFVWKAGKNSLSVFAVVDRFEELSFKTVLYRAPLMNITGGSVCLGSTPWPKRFDQDVLKICSTVIKNFFESKFTHFGSSGVTVSNYYTLFNSLENKEEFPNEELVSYSTLKKEFNGLF
jgi:PRTRC genetic system protein B